MLKSRPAASALGLLLLAGEAGAQTTGAPLALEDCIRLALAAPSPVRAARQQEQIASLGVEEARAAFFPQARAGAAFTYNSPAALGGDLPSYVALNGVREYVGLITVTQEVDTSGRLRAAGARARAERDAATATRGITERDPRRQVAGSYYRVLLARHLAEVAKNALAESQAFAERTRLLFQQGEAARADVVKAEAQAAFLSQSVTAAELDAETANHELASFWTAEVADRLPLRDVLEEAPPAPPPPAPSPAGGLFLRRPELGLLDAERSGFLADAKRARAERRPQASLMFQYGLDSVRLDAADHGYAAFLSLDIPVFDWFRGRKAARQLELQAERIENSRNVLERALSREYQDALSRVRMIHAQIETARSQVALSEQDLRLSRVRYEGGEGSALDVVAAQNQLAQARTNYYTALARYLESRADLAVASGEPLP